MRSRSISAFLKAGRTARFAYNAYSWEHATDVLEIITVLSARINGSRSNKNKKILEGAPKAAEEVSNDTGA